MKYTRLAALALLGLAVSFFLQGQPTATTADVNGSWGIVGGPTYTSLGAYPSIAATYANFGNSTVIGIVFAVIHNSKGQTVEYSTATMALAPGMNGTAQPVVFGLPPGTYSALTFVTMTSGAAISGTAATTFTVTD